MLDDRLKQCQTEESCTEDTTGKLNSQSDVSSAFSGEEGVPLCHSSKNNSSDTTDGKPVTSSDVISHDIVTGTNFFHFQTSTSDFPESSSDISYSLDAKFSLSPGSFDILLCVDNCETLSGLGKSKVQFLDELKKRGVDFDIRKLNVGDFIWVAREKPEYKSNALCRELVLDFVIERKRMDDLSRSIRDGRFREQKFRLRNCGLRRPVYLIEAHRSAHYGLPESTLEQAIMNTQIIDEFLVKRTQGIKDSVEYLSLMTKYLQSSYQHLALISGTKEEVQNPDSPANMHLTFKEFNSVSVKNKCLKISEMFAKHLLQLFGLSVDRAAAIVEKYQTPFKLYEAYHSCSSEDERIKMLSTMKFGKYQKNIGLTLSKAVYQLYCTSGPLS